MTPKLTQPHAASGADAAPFAAAVAAVLLLALGLRVAAYTGFFGSDEVTYVESAFRLLDGDWRVDDYVGANRMGVNLPMAAFGALFGRVEAAAAAWSVLCSLAEVALVGWAGRAMFGARVGLLAALLLATLPVHVHFAGRIMADAPLALCVSAAFALFFVAEHRRSWRRHLVAGLFAGLSFWMKPVTLFVFAVLLAYPLLVRRIDRRWSAFVLGTLLALTANGLLMLQLTGNFWFVIDAMRTRSASGYLEATAALQQTAHDAGFYLQYLFFKVHHTALLGYLGAFGALLLVLRRVDRHSTAAGAAGYLLLWSLGLVALLSLLVVSWRPLMLIPKQVNYMLLFAVPLCLLGGVALAALPRLWQYLIGGAAAASGLLLALLLQGSVAVFTANSLGTLALAAARPDADFYVMSNAYRAARFERWVGRVDLTERMHAMDQWSAGAHRQRPRLAVVDAETFAWDGSHPFERVDAVPACWQPAGVVEPIFRGAGVWLLRQASATMTLMPGLSGSGLAQRLARLSQPLPARVYLVPAGSAC